MAARRRIESFFLRKAGAAVRDLADGETDRLARALVLLDERRANVVAAEAALQDLERRLVRFGPAHADGRAQIEHLLAGLEQRDAELVRLRWRAQEAAARVAQFDAERSRLERERARSDHRVQELESSLRALRDRLAEADDGHAHALEEVRRLERRAATVDELDARQRALERTAAELDRREADLRRLERVDERAAELRERAAAVAERERSLGEREAKLDSVEEVDAWQRLRTDRQGRRLTELEDALMARVREVEEREAAVESRAADVEADADLNAERKRHARAELVIPRGRLRGWTPRSLAPWRGWKTA